MAWRKDHKHHQPFSDNKGGPVSQPISGCAQTWRLWRHCCCRYGWYPLIVAPVITVGFLLSMYCSLGCQFIEVDVGFTPSNDNWNQSEVRLGLFYYYTGVERYEENPLNGDIYDIVAQGGCELYTPGFQEEFLDGDRTWRVTRIMAMISGFASLMAALTTWLFVLSPLPTSFFWPGVLLPAQMIAFLSESSKFLLFDTAVCRTTLWKPSGEVSNQQAAEACRLGDTGFICIAAGTVHFIGLMFVCLKAPGKRDLDLSFGKNYDTSSAGDDNVSDDRPSIGISPNGDFHHHTGRGEPQREMFPEGSDVYVIGTESSIHDHQVDVGYPDDSESQISVSTGQQTKNHRHHHHHHRHHAGAVGGGNSTVGGGNSTIEQDADTYSRDGRDVASGGILCNSEELRDDVSRTSVGVVSTVGDINTNSDRSSRLFDPNRTAAEIVMGNHNKFQISESRVSKIEKMELNSVSDSDDLIERFVTDLNLSFQSKDTTRS